MAHKLIVKDLENILVKTFTNCMNFAHWSPKSVKARLKKYTKLSKNFNKNCKVHLDKKNKNLDSSKIELIMSCKI